MISHDLLVYLWTKKKRDKYSHCMEPRCWNTCGCKREDINVTNHKEIMEDNLWTVIAQHFMKWGQGGDYFSGRQHISSSCTRLHRSKWTEMACT